jgi:hypothetical protein
MLGVNVSVVIEGALCKMWRVLSLGMPAGPAGPDRPPDGLPPERVHMLAKKRGRKLEVTRDCCNGVWKLVLMLCAQLP